MNTAEEDPLPEVDPEPRQTDSLPARLFNVIAGPGEVFDELKGSKPAHSNWVVPILLSMLVGVIFSVVAFSQPDIVASVFAQHEQTVAAQVESGKLSRAEADEALQGMRMFQSGKLMMVFGSLGAVFGTLIFFAVVSVLIWILAAKILKGDVSLKKCFEFVGLAAMINVLGGVITLLIVLLKGNIAAAPNAALLLGTFNPASYLHQFLATLNVITLWYMAVLSLGVSRLASRSFAVAAAWVFGVWAIIRIPLACATAWWTQFQSNGG